MPKKKKDDPLKSISDTCKEAESLLKSLETDETVIDDKKNSPTLKERPIRNDKNLLKNSAILLFAFGFAATAATIMITTFRQSKFQQSNAISSSQTNSKQSRPQISDQSEPESNNIIQPNRSETTIIQQSKPKNLPYSGLTEQQARQIVEKWLSVKSEIFAPPFNINLADQIVANGPLWRDLTKPDGSIPWLKKNSSYYTYSMIRINRVINYQPSPSSPSITVSVTETSNLHSSRGIEKKTSTQNWVYTLKKEAGLWKILDYRKK